MDQTQRQVSEHCPSGLFQPAPPPRTAVRAHLTAERTHFCGVDCCRNPLEEYAYYQAGQSTSHAHMPLLPELRMQRSRSYCETPEVLKALSLYLSAPLSICLSVYLCLSPSLPSPPLSFLSLFCHLFIVFLHLFTAVIILFEKARLKKQIKVNERGKQKLEKQTFYQKAKLAKTIMGNTPRIQFRNF